METTIQFAQLSEHAQLSALTHDLPPYYATAVGGAKHKYVKVCTCGRTAPEHVYRLSMNPPGSGFLHSDDGECRQYSDSGLRVAELIKD